MLQPILLAFVLGVVAQQPQEVVADILVQGNLLTPDAEVRQLAGIEIGMPVSIDTPSVVAARLRGTERFKRVEVLKRFASISDPTQIVLVVILDEGPVKVVWDGDSGTPARVVRRRGFGLLFLPVLQFEDGYGLTYGVRLTRADLLGGRSRLSFPLTWGGDKRAAVELDKTFARGPVTRVEAGGALSRRRHPFYEEDESREQVWVTAGRDLTGSLRVSVMAGWQHVALLDPPEGNARFLQNGAALVFDTRLDPMLARNALYARAAWERSALNEGHVPGSDVGDRSVNQIKLDGRGYVGLPGRGVLVVRAAREDADGAAPPYLKSMLGGMPNLRGFERGTAVGDTLVAGSMELRVPMSSPFSLGKVGVSAFVDVGTAYDNGQRLENQKLERGAGGSVWFSAAFLRLSLAVARGMGQGTRVHFGTGVSP